jgi:poly(A) polymerase/tRNA nucleotidyltransferase (CCA-adding enzyme)
MKYFVPQPVLETLDTLAKAGFEAFIVGGCVRDLLLAREPKDWDITTNALPDEVLALFPDSFYENEFGTVGVKVERFSAKPRASKRVEGSLQPEHAQEKEDVDIIEVTTYRKESTYSDKRRPDTVSFVSTLEEDLARRDFTMNAMAAGTATDNRQPITDNTELTIIDPFDGRKDIAAKIIRAVGDADARFGEDALRMMRAIRLFSELTDDRRPTTDDNGKTWTIEEKTFEAIKKHAPSTAHVSWERIRDEFSRIILSDHPADGVDLLEKTGLLKVIIPELEEGVGVGQNLHHIYTVWEHNLRALATCPSKKLSVRLAALLHDVGKPRTKHGEGLHSTFYNHDHVGARMVRPLLQRMRYSTEIIEKTTLLVDNHLFYYNVGEVSEASVRRLIRRVGLENMHDLMDVRIADRLGSGVPKAKPYKLRHLEYMIDKVSKDPVSVKMLGIHGNDLIDVLGMQPGPKIGAILDVLLAEVIEDPTRNGKESLLARARVLDQEDLATLREKAKETIEEKQEKDDRDIKKKHWVE